MALSQNPPRQLNAAVIFAMAVFVIVALTLVAVFWGSEDAKSVEDMSAARAEAAVAAIDIPDGTTVVVDGADHDVTFDGVVARLQEGDDSGSKDRASESANALDPADQVCSDETLTNLCKYARGEPVATPTPQPTPTGRPVPKAISKPTEKPTKEPTAKTTAPRVAQPTPTPRPSTNRSRPAPTPTRVARPVPTTGAQVAPTSAPGIATPSPTASTPSPAASTPSPAASTPSPTASTPSPAPGTETPETPAPTPIVDAPTAEPTNPVAGTGTDTPGDVVYIYTEPPSAENPSPPVMECLVSADGSLDCPAAGA